MRGASALPGIGCTGRAKTSAGRVPSAAIFGMGPCVVISTNFWSSAAPSAGGVAFAGATLFAGAGIRTSCFAPVLPSMIVIVVVLAGGIAAAWLGGDDA